MNKTARKKGLEVPFLFNNFNISAWWPNLDTRGISHLITPLVEVMNDKTHHRLVKYIIIIPDQDLLINMQANNFTAARVIGVVFHHMICQIDLFIERTKQDLLEKRVGARQMIIQK